MSLPTALHRGPRGKGAAGSRGGTPRTGRGCEEKRWCSVSFEVRHGELHHAKNYLVLVALTGAAWCLRVSGNLWGAACPTSRPSPSALFAWGICGGTLIRTDGKGRGWHLWFRPAIYTAFGGGSVLPSCGLNGICPSVFARTRDPCRQVDSGLLPAGRWVSTKQAQIRSLGDQQNQLNGNIRLNLAQLKRTTNFISEAIKPTGMLGSKSKENSFHYFISVIQTLPLPLRMKTRRQKIHTSLPLQSNALQTPFQFPSRSTSGEPLPLGQSHQALQGHRLQIRKSAEGGRARTATRCLAGDESKEGLVLINTKTEGCTDQVGVPALSQHCAPCLLLPADRQQLTPLR